MIRNAEMLKENPDLVVAFPGGNGTIGMIKLAKANQINIMEISMSKLLNEIKLNQLEARKKKDTVEASLLTTLLGEYEALTKMSNSQSDDEILIMLIKKFIKNIDITAQVKDSENLQREKRILEEYLPKQLSEAELELIIVSYSNDGADTVGLAMKRLKEEYPGMYDGKLASEVARNVL